MSGSNITKTDERIFMKLSAKVEREARNNMKRLWNAAVNSLNPGSIFFFSIRVC